MDTVLRQVEAAIADIKVGKMIIVVDDENRENEGDLIMAASKVTPKHVNFMMREGRGLICVPIAQEMADKLQLWPMVVQNTERAHTNFTVSVDAKKGTTTGISASDRAITIKALSSSLTKPDDLLRPGHIFPLRAQKGGVLARPGHTEAACDLAKLAGLSPVGLVCEIIKENGEMARLPELKKFAHKHGLKIISIQSLIQYRSRNEIVVEKVAESPLLTAFGSFDFMVFRSLFDQKEHIALVKGKVDPKNTMLVRVHSECLTGDVFSSGRCDCGPQLTAALTILSKEKNGILLYMRQEGRGIGLINKIKAYQLQHQKGYDTVEANKRLGFGPDLRDYNEAAQILKLLGVKKIRLLTNNPKKIEGMNNHGLKVIERLPLEIAPTKYTRQYLATKKTRLGHLLHDV